METIIHRGYTINQVKDGYEVCLPSGQLISPSLFRTLDDAQNWVYHEKRVQWFSSLGLSKVTDSLTKLPGGTCPQTGYDRPNIIDYSLAYSLAYNGEFGL